MTIIKVKIRPKNIDCVFTKHEYNSNSYQFIVHKLSIEEIHHNTIMESRNTILFEDVFPWKEGRDNYSHKRIVEANTSNHHQLQDVEIELRKSKREKMTKTFDPDFLTYYKINLKRTLRYCLI
jgi:hypothetical protein